MRDQQTLLRRVDVGLALAGLGAGAYVVTRLSTAGSWGWGAVAMLGTAIVFAVPVAVVIGRRDHRMVLDTPVLIPAVLLLSAGR